MIVDDSYRLRRTDDRGAGDRPQLRGDVRLTRRMHGLSFIVPAHNEERLLGRTLHAIAVASGALGERTQVIVADDASSDHTAAVAREHDAFVVSVNRRQIAAARNAGAKVATGE